MPFAWEEENFVFVGTFSTVQFRANFCGQMDIVESDSSFLSAAKTVKLITESKEKTFDTYSSHAIKRNRQRPKRTPKREIEMWVVLGVD